MPGLPTAATTRPAASPGPTTPTRTGPAPVATTPSTTTPTAPPSPRHQQRRRGLHLHRRNHHVVLLRQRRPADHLRHRLRRLRPHHHPGIQRDHRLLRQRPRPPADLRHQPTDLDPGRGRPPRHLDHRNPKRRHLDPERIQDQPLRRRRRQPRLDPGDQHHPHPQRPGPQRGPQHRHQRHGRHRPAADGHPRRRDGAAATGHRHLTNRTRLRRVRQPAGRRHRRPLRLARQQATVQRNGHRRHPQAG